MFQSNNSCVMAIHISESKYNEDTKLDAIKSLDGEHVGNGKKILQRYITPPQINMEQSEETSVVRNIFQNKNYKLHVKWENTIIFVLLQTIWLYVIYLVLGRNVKIGTLMFGVMYGLFINLGIRVGVHKLWSYKTYTGNLVVRLVLMLMQTGSLQNLIYQRNRKLKIDHKYTDSTATEFISPNLGWVMSDKHLNVIKKGDTVEVSDMLADPVVKFQMKYFIPLVLLSTQLIPVVISWYLFGDSLWKIWIIYLGSYIMNLFFAWTVKGTEIQPDDKESILTENHSTNSLNDLFLLSKIQMTNNMDLKETARNEDSAYTNGLATETIHSTGDDIAENNKNINGDSNNYKLQIVWRNVIVFTILHVIFLYSIFLILTFRVKWKTLAFEYVYLWFGIFGSTAGAHRLWSHKSYTANLPLRIFLMFGQSVSLQNHIFEWARDHRVHHKFTDTNADPHNSTRGFFFSHVGWLLCKKHPDVITMGKTVDVSDLLEDPVVRFQKRYYLPLVTMCTFVIPTFIPWYFFGEDAWISFVVAVGKYVLSLNGAWSVNSAAHTWGVKPYDRYINPTENKFVTVITCGEGYHNYHHVFPWDYKAAELGNDTWNSTTVILDFMAKIGWATDLKTTSLEMITKRVRRTGDGTWTKNHIHHPDDSIWGWGDKDMNQDEIGEIKKMNLPKTWSA